MTNKACPFCAAINPTWWHPHEYSCEKCGACGPAENLDYDWNTRPGEDAAEKRGAVSVLRYLADIKDAKATYEAIHRTLARYEAEAKGEE